MATAFCWSLLFLWPTLLIWFNCAIGSKRHEHTESSASLTTPASDLSSIIPLLFFVRPQTTQLWGRLALMPPRQTHPQSEPNTGSIHSPLDPDMIQNLNPYHGKWTVLSVTSAFFKADWGTCLCNPSCKAQRFHQRLTFPLQQYLSISPTGLFFMALQSMVLSVLP